MQKVSKVLYTQDQSEAFTTEQKAVARNNIGAQEALTAGGNITIDGNVISSTDTTYTAGENVQINSSNVISATDTKYTAGSNVQINSNNVISATDTTYTAGSNVQINGNNVISATDTTYSAGTNVQIDSNNVISATDTTYTAGTNVQISNSNVISATDTTYSAGENIRIGSNHEISATTIFRSWIFRERSVTITAQDLANGYVDFTYVLGEDGVVVAERPNIIAMKGYDIESGNQLNGRSLSFLIVPHGGGVAVLMDSGFQLYTESVVNNYQWKAFKAIGLTMGANVGKYDAVLRVSLDGTEPEGSTIGTDGRLAVTLVGLVG